MCTVRVVDTEKSGPVSNECPHAKLTGRGGWRMELEVRRLPRERLPSVLTVHVRATSSKSERSQTLRASWTFIVVDRPLIVNVR